MMGDTGANALGALAGALALEQLGTRGRVGALAALAAIALAPAALRSARNRALSAAVVLLVLFPFVVAPVGLGALRFPWAA